MRHYITLVLGLTLGAVLLGCGGGSSVSSTSPDKNDTRPARVAPEAPIATLGSHATTFLPDKLNVLSGSSRANLQAVVAKYGYTVDFKDRGWASVTVPAGTDLDQAAALLEKEYCIISAEKVQQADMPRAVYASSGLSRSASFVPLDPAYADQFLGFSGTGNAVIVTGTSTNAAASPTVLTDANAKFLTGDYPVVAGDVVTMDVSGETAAVASVDSETQLTTAALSGGDTYVAGETYSINSNIVGYNAYFGTGFVMNSMGFEGAWDTSDPLNIRGDVAAQPVRVAIIDAGWLDYSTVNRPGFDETLLDTDATTGCGAVAADGTFTAGLAAAAWETFVEHVMPADYYRISPLRGAGEEMLGMLAAAVNDYTVRATDPDNPADGITKDEIWNEGIAGINPNATYILLKTGTASGETWTFNDQQIAASINRAWNESDADVILLGMAINGALPANVTAAIQSARDNGALVIAPAGDVIDSWNGNGTPPYFDDPVYDIGTTTFWPASDANCLSVTGTGVDRTDTFPDVNIPTPVPNVGRGWYPGFTAPFDEPFYKVTNYCNTGADIAAVGFGIGFGLHPNLLAATSGDGSQATPYEFEIGETLATQVSNFGTMYAAAYVAGAASFIHQALQFGGSVADPNDYDDNIETALLDTAMFKPLTGVANSGGFMNTNLAIQQAMNGTQLFIPGMALSTLVVSQPLGAVTRGTPFSFTPTVANGTAPFTISVAWGTGVPADDLVDVAWNNGDPVELTAGFDKIGPTGVSFTVKDSKNQTVGAGMELIVMNPLAINITMENDQGAIVPPAALQVGTTYRFRANPTNLYTGDVGGVPNFPIAYSWDMNGDGTEDATGASPAFAFATAGTFTISLTVTEPARPNASPWTRSVTVN